MMTQAQEDHRNKMLELARIAMHPHRLIDQLTPKRWAEAFGPQPPALIELEHDQ
jgi:hypothetical protein